MKMVTPGSRCRTKDREVTIFVSGENKGRMDLEGEAGLTIVL